MKFKPFEKVLICVIPALFLAGFIGISVASADEPVNPASKQAEAVAAKNDKRERQFDACTKIDRGDSSVTRLSCEETVTYRGREMHCLSSETDRDYMVCVPDYTRFYAENPDLAKADAAAGKARVTTPAK